MKDADISPEEYTEAAEVADAPAAEDGKTEYIEFLGDDPRYKTEFYRYPAGTHTITNAHMKQYHNVDLGKKEIVWRKEYDAVDAPMLVPVSDMTPEAAAVLEKDAMFRRVTR